MKQGRDSELVALRQPRDLADPLGRDPDRDPVAAKALMAPGRRARRLKRVVSLEPIGERRDAVGIQVFNRLAHSPGPPGRALSVVGGAHHRGDKCGVGLDRLGDVRRRRRLALTETDESPTRFQEGRHLGNCVEGVCEAPASDPGTAVTRTRALCVECLAHRRFRALRRVRSHASTP